jgi:hypothetical protein
LKRSLVRKIPIPALGNRQIPIDWKRRKPDLDSVKWLGTVLQNCTAFTLQQGTMRAVLALKESVLLLANKACQLVEEITTTVVAKEFVKKHLATCKPFLEMTLTRKISPT